MMFAESHSLPTIELDGMTIHAVTEDEAIAHVLDSLDRCVGGWVVTPNVDHLRRFRSDPAAAELAAQADLTVADGMPLLWAAWVQGTPLPERVAGSSLISTLSLGAAERDYSIYLLGGNPGAAEAAAKVLQDRSPELLVAGSCCPQISADPDRDDLDALEAQLLEARPDIVFVGLGSPKQELLIRRLRSLLPSTWFLGVGISFSFLAGEVRRAPVWMQRSGLEWFHRLSQEPWRLAKRYLVQGLPFVAGMLARAAWRRVFHRTNTAPASATFASKWHVENVPPQRRS